MRGEIARFSGGIAGFAPLLALYRPVCVVKFHTAAAIVAARRKPPFTPYGVKGGSLIAV